MSRQRVMRNFSYLTVGTALQTILSFVCTIRIARALGPDSYGVFALVVIVVSIVQIVSSLSLRNVVIREIARRPQFLPSIARQLVILNIAPVVLGSVGLVSYLWYVESIRALEVLGAATILFLANSIWTAAESLAFGKQEMQYSSILLTVSGVVWFIVIFALPWAALTMTVVLGSFAVIQLGRAFAYLIIEWNRGYFRPVVNGEPYDVPALLYVRQSLPVYSSAMLSIPVSQMPLLFLSWFANKAEVGFFGVGTRLTQPLYLLSQNLFSAIYPRLAEVYAKDLLQYKSEGKRFLEVLVLIGLFMTVILSGFSKELVVGLFGDQYAGAVRPFSVQIWMALLLVVTNYIGAVIISSNNERKLYVLSTINAVIVGTSTFMGAYHGAWGVAAGTALASFVGLVIHWYPFRNILGLREIDGMELKLLLTSIVPAVVLVSLQTEEVFLRVAGTIAVLALLVIVHYRELLSILRLAKELAFSERK